MTSASPKLLRGGRYVKLVETASAEVRHHLVRSLMGSLVGRSLA
jgi:hypothetical protein